MQFGSDESFHPFTTITIPHSITTNPKRIGIIYLYLLITPGGTKKITMVKFLKKLKKTSKTLTKPTIKVVVDAAKVIEIIAKPLLTITNIITTGIANALASVPVLNRIPVLRNIVSVALSHFISSLLFSVVAYQPMLQELKNMETITRIRYLKSLFCDSIRSLAIINDIQMIVSPFVKEITQSNYLMLLSFFRKNEEKGLLKRMLRNLEYSLSNTLASEIAFYLDGFFGKYIEFVGNKMNSLKSKYFAVTFFNEFSNRSFDWARESILGKVGSPVNFFKALFKQMSIEIQSKSLDMNNRLRLKNVISEVDKHSNVIRFLRNRLYAIRNIRGSLKSGKLLEIVNSLNHFVDIYPFRVASNSITAVKEAIKQLQAFGNRVDDTTDDLIGLIWGVLNDHGVFDGFVGELSLISGLRILKFIPLLVPIAGFNNLQVSVLPINWSFDNQISLMHLANFAEGAYYADFDSYSIYPWQPLGESLSPDSKVRIVYYGNYPDVVISIRGSISNRDVLEGFFISVHSIVEQNEESEYYKYVCKVVNTAIEDFKYKGFHNFMVVGHSLGGILAHKYVIENKDNHDSTQIRAFGFNNVLGVQMRHSKWLQNSLVENDSASSLIPRVDGDGQLWWRCRNDLPGKYGPKLLRILWNIHYSSKILHSIENHRKSIEYEIQSRK